jgi:shikimate kinase
MMGSGKTTVGKLLAKRLGWRFADTDSIVERREGMSVSRLFESKGEPAFRRLESQALRSIKGRHWVVATGGGLVLKKSNRLWMRQHGVVVYLRAPLSLSLRRLAGQEGSRPLLAQGKKALAAMARQRRPLYQEASVQLSADAAPSKLAAAIWVKISQKASQVLYDKTAR